MKGTAIGWTMLRVRGVLLGLPLLFALLAVRFESAEALMWPLGVAVALAGIGMRVWAQQHIGRRLDFEKRLTVSGPYTVVRNPLYIANILLCVGATLVSRIVWLAPITLLWTVGIYSLVVRYEEERLLVKYGEPYRRYLSEVPRWLPRFNSHSDLAFTTPHLRAAILAELHCFFLLCPFAVKEIVEAWILTR